MSEPENTKSILETALNAAHQMTEVKYLADKGIPFIIAPMGMQKIDLEANLPKPTHVKQNVNFQELVSFMAYVNEFKTPRTRIFALKGCTSANIHAQIDYHDKDGDPSWCAHRAQYTCPSSREWSTWTSRNTQAMDQETFADFLETNMEDIVEPAGARMMEMALTLSIKKDVQFQSGIRLQDGSTKFLYNEDIQTAAGKGGELSMPDRFVLALAPFDGGPKYKITARLRFRLNQRKLTFTYELLKVQDVIRDAFGRVKETVEKETGISVWLGQ